MSEMKSPAGWGPSHQTSPSRTARHAGEFALFLVLLFGGTLGAVFTAIVVGVVVLRVVLWRELAVELWTWLFNSGERAAISAMPSVGELRDLAPPLTRDVVSFGIAAIARLPRRVRYALPVIHVLQARFRAVSVN